MTLVAVKDGSGRLSHRRRKHRWQLRGAKQLSELRSAILPRQGQSSSDPVLIRLSFLHNFPTEGRMVKKVSFKTDPAFRQLTNGIDDPAKIRFSFCKIDQRN